MIVDPSDEGRVPGVFVFARMRGLVANVLVSGLEFGLAFRRVRRTGLIGDGGRRICIVHFLYELIKQVSILLQ